MIRLQLCAAGILPATDDYLTCSMDIEIGRIQLTHMTGISVCPKLLALWKESRLVSSTLLQLSKFPKKLGDL